MKNSEKHTILIDEILYQDIKEYCELNNIKTNVFINKILKKSFMIEKFGESPFENIKKQKDIIETNVQDNNSFKKEEIKEKPYINDAIEEKTKETSILKEEIIFNENKPKKRKLK